MDTEHDDHQNDVDKVVGEPADSSYRTAFRSNILKRIYEKNARYSPDIIENTLKKEDGLTEHFNDKEKTNNRQQLPSRLVPLRSEWRKTLERILNPTYLDGQLEISRKDALAFFIQKEWPPEDDGASKGRREKKKSKKPPTPTPDPNLDPVVTKHKVTWKSLSDSNSTKLSSILKDKTENAIEATRDSLLPQTSSLYERCILRSLQSREYLYQLGYLFKRNESSKAFRFFRWIYDCFVQYNSGPGKLISSPQTAQYSTQKLNNNRFLLEVALAEISFSKHYLMDDESKLLRLLNVTFEQYEKSISAKVNHQLKRTNEVIQVISAKIKNSSQTKDDNNEHQLDVDLLQRLVDFQRSIINNRRKSLIELLRVWDRVMSHKSTSKLVTSNCLNLSLEEAENVDEEKERAEWNELIEENVLWEQLLHGDSKVDRKSVQSITYLLDGRLPGEPKFKSIELTYSRLNTDKESHLDLLYTIQISIGEKNHAQFEPIYLKSDFANLKWSQSVSISFPWFKNAQHSDYFSLSQTDSPSEINQANFEDYCDMYLPKICIYEKAAARKGAKSTAQDSRLVWQCTVTDLPRFYQKSADNAKQFESNFEFTFKEEDNGNRLRIKGNLQLCTYWKSIPSDAKSIADSSTAELIFDQEKRQIKGITDLKAIDQTLHDLRYLNAISLETFAADDYFSSSDSMRRIQLIELCLRQKYHIELSSNLILKEENVRKSKSNVQENKAASAQLDIGSFCSEEEIEQNKKFQLMIYRNSGASKNVHKLRFIPLNNVTDVMLQNAMLRDKTEMISIELLLDYLTHSCREQQKRLQGVYRRKQKKKKKNVDFGGKIFHDWCLIVSPTDGNTSRQFMSASNLMQTIVQVIEKIDFDGQSPVNGETVNQTNGFFNSGSRILAFEDIIREDSIESLETTEFSLFSSCAKMSRSKLNPSRKDRRKVAITLSEALEREVQVVLSVQHALNVPMRRNPEEQSVEDDEDEEDDDDLDRFTPCASFVEVAFDSTRISTSIAEGPQPTWNENFRFKLKLDPRQHISLNLFEVLKSVRSNSLSSDQSTAKVTRSTSTKQKHNLHQEVADQELNVDALHLEKRFFGQFKVPLSAILFNSKIEGTFTLSSPYFLNDYKSISSPASKASKKSRQSLLDQSESETGTTNITEDAKMISTVRQIKSLYLDDADQTLLGTIPDIALSFFVTIDPAIEPLAGTQFSTKNISLESAELVEHCNRWLVNLHSQFQNRHFLCMVENIQHQLVFICRFLTPIKPPDLKDLISLDKLTGAPKGSKGEDGAKKLRASMKKLVHREAIYLQMIIRYVSLIPSFSQNFPTTSSDYQSWWQLLSRQSTVLDISQFLSLRMGFRMEHAIYLCCMLQYLDRNTCLLYGNSLTEGPTGAVILYPTTTALNSFAKDDSSNELEPVVINPKTGEQFGVRDLNITLNSIDCIVTNDNVYANIQKNFHPNAMQYNLRKSSHWQPLFSSAKDIARFTSTQDGHEEQLNEFISIQPDMVEYSNSVDNMAATNLESRLENYLREQLMSWRRQQAVTFTAFNRYCTQVIRRILPQLETHACLAATSGSMYNQAQQVAAIEEALLEELAQVHSVHSIVGYPLHVSPLFDFEQIAQMVYSTGVHLLDATFSGAERMNNLQNNPAMLEYVVATYVHSYPANVHSIWVYVGALIPKT